MNRSCLRTAALRLTRRRGEDSGHIDFNRAVGFHDRTTAAPVGPLDCQCASMPGDSDSLRRATAASNRRRVNGSHNTLRISRDVRLCVIKV